MSWPMVLGIACWAVSALGIFQLAYAIHRLLRSDSLAVNAMSFVFLLMFSTTLITLVVGLAGLLRPLPMAVVGGGVWAVIRWLDPEEFGFQRMRRSLSFLISRAAVWWGELPVWLRWLTGVGVGASAIRFAFLVWALPPFVWDALTYHLTNVAEWTQRGQIGVFETPVIRIYSPANFEVLTTWFTVFLHHDAVIEASGIPSYVVAVLAVYAICRGLGSSRQASWLAGIGYGSTPALLLATTGTKNDPQVAAMCLGLIAIGINLGYRPSGDHERNPVGQAVLALLILLYGFGTKTYIVHLLPGVVLIAAFGIWRSQSERSESGILRRARDQLAAADTGLRLGLAILVLAGAFLGFYWNVRNWALTGNPFFPYGVTIGDRQVVPSGDRTAHLGLDRLAANLGDLGAKFGDRLSPVVPDLPDTTGWGWFAYGLGLPALVWSLLRSPRARVLCAGFSLSLLVLFLSDRPSPWSMRYAIWFPALFTVGFAAYFDGLPDIRTAYRRILIGLLTITLGLNFIMTINEGRVSPEDFQAMLSRPIWDRQAASLRLTVPEEYANALEFVPQDAILGYNVTGNGFIYPLYRADFSQRLTYIPLEADEPCEEVARTLEEHGTRYLSVAPEQTDDGLMEMLARCAGSQSSIRERARGLYVVKQPD